MRNQLHFIILSVFLSLALPHSGHCEEDTDPASTPNLAEASFKDGEVFVKYYKFVVLIENGKPTRLLYQNLERFELHRDFLATLPEFRGLTKGQIDAQTYFGESGRRAYLGVLSIRSGDDKIEGNRFSLAMAEAPEVDQIMAIRDLLLQSAENGRFKKPFEFELLPHQVTGFAGRVEALAARGVKVYKDADAQTSIAYTDGWNVGTLRTVTDQADLDAKVKSGVITADTIILAKGPLREIPLVAGVISTQRLTPMSHTVLLAQMYGIPVAYMEKAEQIFSSLEGAPLFLDAHGGMMDDKRAEFFARPSSQDIAVLKSLRSRPKVEIAFDPSVMEIRDAAQMTMNDLGAFGGKGAQAGSLLRHLPNNSLGRAREIPLGHYVKFMLTAKASTGETLAEYRDRMIATLSEADQLSVDRVESVMTKIRSEILAAQFPQDSLQYIEKTLLLAFPEPGVKMRLRSSGNAEDGEEVSAPGAYESEGFYLVGEKAGKLDKKIKKVYASVFNTRAFMARRRFGIDEKRVGMALLVHKAFRDELANSVVRLHVDKERKYFTFQIVTLKGAKKAEGDLVTHATSEKRAEVISLSLNKSFDSRFMAVDQPFEGFSNQRSIFPSQVYWGIADLIEKVSSDYDRPGEEIDIEGEVKVYGSDEKLEYTSFLKQVRRVPHPKTRTAPDGSRFVVLGGKIEFQRSHYNNATAFTDLWTPQNLVLDIPTFSESQLRGGKISVRSVSFDMSGQSFQVNNPPVSVSLKDNGYSLAIDLPNPNLPSLRLMATKSFAQPRSHSMTDFSVHMETSFGEQDVTLLEKLNLYQTTRTADYVSCAQQLSSPRKAGRIGTISFVTAGSRPVVITGRQTVFTGEGDRRSVRIGEATIQGVWTRPLVIPGKSIGYGANHHEGAESFVFDLTADPQLSATDREKLTKSQGRYLYLNDSLSSMDHKSHLVLLRPDGKTKDLGIVKSQQTK